MKLINDSLSSDQPVTTTTNPVSLEDKWGDQLLLTFNSVFSGDNGGNNSDYNL